MKKLVSFGLVLAMLFAALALVACGGGVTGTYYSESGEEYIKLSGGKWSMGETDGEEVMSGSYEVTEGGISFKVAILGDTEVEMFTGKVSGKELTLSFLGEDSAVFTRK